MDNQMTIASGQRPKRVTISDVARSLNMAKGTVSRALNGYSDISEHTRTRVKAEADRLGYRPLALAQAIRTGQARSIGLVIQEDESGGTAPFLAEFLAGVSTAASERDWTLTVATATSLDGVLETQARLISERKADGFILPRSRVDDPRVKALANADVPFVLFGREPTGADCAWFDVAGEDAMRQAVVRLAGLGHSRIGFLRGDDDYVYTDLRVQGYRQGLAQAGLPFDPDLIGGQAVTIVQGQQAAAQLLSLPAPPTAFVCSVDRAALGLYRAAAQAGLQIGRDLSVISYDGIPEGAFASPPLTTFSVDRRHAGERLASILISLIVGEGTDTPRELTPARLIDGGSDGPPALTSAQIASKWASASETTENQREETS